MGRKFDPPSARRPRGTGRSSARFTWKLTQVLAQNPAILPYSSSLLSLYLMTVRGSACRLNFCTATTLPLGLLQGPGDRRVPQAVRVAPAGEPGLPAQPLRDPVDRGRVHPPRGPVVAAGPAVEPEERGPGASPRAAIHAASAFAAGRLIVSRTFCSFPLPSTLTRGSSPSRSTSARSSPLTSDRRRPPS